jgi:hypothetical protein
MIRLRLVSVPLTILLLAGCTTVSDPEGRFAPIDRTSELAKNLADSASYVEEATETEPGRVVVETNLVDPGGDDNSPAAALAIVICNAAVTLGDVDHISVLEADGTSFVLFGHPSVPEGQCTEV